MKRKMYALSASLALCIISVIILLLSCEKTITADDESANTIGNLRVTVYQIEQTPFSSLTRATASEACTRLNFAVYTSNCTRVKLISQVSSDATFGQCVFQLAEGTYQLVVVGHSSSANPTMTDLSKVQFTNATGYTDTFLCYGEVTIGEEPLDLRVSLDRIVALCRFVITDDIPADVKKMEFYYTGGSGAFDATTGLGCVNSKQDVKFDVTASQKQFDLYTFLHNIEGTIHLTVTALDGSGNELYRREFEVPMQQNHITWLSGAFFNGSGSSHARTCGDRSQLAPLVTVPVTGIARDTCPW